VAADLADDPEQAYQFTLAARRLAARVGVVREACAIAAYRAGAGPRRSPSCVPRVG
jgi:hypothetical protein